jgi:hypothetical protein
MGTPSTSRSSHTVAVSNRSAAKRFGSRRIQVGNQDSTQASFVGIKPSQR